jgi:hypothetical protein
MCPREYFTAANSQRTHKASAKFNAITRRMYVLSSNKVQLVIVDELVSGGRSHGLRTICPTLPTNMRFFRPNNTLGPTFTPIVGLSADRFRIIPVRHLSVASGFPLFTH